MWGALAVASLSLAACSSDELVEDQSSNVAPEVPVEQGFQELGEFSVASKLGNLDTDKHVSKTALSVDINGRPSTVYPLNFVNLMKLSGDVQPTSDCVGEVVDYAYNRDPEIVRHDLLMNVATGQSSYKIYYKLSGITSNADKGASESGKITLSTDKNGSNSVTLDLSIFKLSDLAKVDGEPVDPSKHILLNQFAYDCGVEGNLRGDALRYISYNPKDLEGDPARSGSVYAASGKYVSLPEITEGFDLLRDQELPRYSKLYTEIDDKYFTSPEVLFASANGKIYLLSSVVKDTRAGGYYLKRTYPAPEGRVTPKNIEMQRLTTIVNTSLMIVDQDQFGEGSYFKEGNKTATLANFKKLFGVDLSDLSCPYATFDGFNKTFYINDYKNIDRSEDRCRMVMWGEGMEAYLPVYDGISEIPSKVGVASMDLNFNFDDHNVRRGYGIKGNSYSVAFEGSQNDTQAQEICFWVNVDGAKVKVIATTPQDNGIAFHMNTSHNVMVMVKASDFAQAVKDIKAGANRSADGYGVLRVSADNVVVTD